MKEIRKRSTYTLALLLIIWGLATLAILVWHFYQVFLDPDVYPMNWAWWDGKMPEKQYRHEHELDKDSF